MKIKRPHSLLINYKYTATMSDVNRPLHEFYNSIFKKHIDEMYNGKTEFFVSTEYNINNHKFRQIDLDFDGLNSISEVKTLAKELQKIGLENYFYIQFTGNGYHLKSNFAVKDLEYNEIKNSKFISSFKTLDIGASLRQNPSRMAWSYSFKNNVTCYTLGLPYFFKYNINQYNNKFKQIPMEVLSLTLYKKMLYLYCLPIFYINKNDKIFNKLKIIL